MSRNRTSMPPVRPRSSSIFNTNQETDNVSITPSDIEPKMNPCKIPNVVNISPHVRGLQTYRVNPQPTRRAFQSIDNSSTAPKYELRKVFTNTEQNRNLGINGKPWLTGPGSAVTQTDLREQLAGMAQRHERKKRKRIALIALCTFAFVFLVVFLPTYLSTRDGCSNESSSGIIIDETVGFNTTTYNDTDTSVDTDTPSFVDTDTATGNDTHTGVSSSVSPSPSASSLPSPTRTASAAASSSATVSPSSSISATTSSLPSATASPSSEPSATATASASASTSTSSEPSATATASASTSSEPSSASSLPSVTASPTQTPSPPPSSMVSSYPSATPLTTNSTLIDTESDEGDEFFTLKFPPNLFTGIGVGLVVTAGSVAVYRTVRNTQQ